MSCSGDLTYPIVAVPRRSGGETSAFLALVAIVGASQWSMIYLSYAFASGGRHADAIAVSPELVVGTLALVLSGFALISRRDFVFPKKVWSVLSPLPLFVICATVSELFQESPSYRSIVSVFALLLYCFTGLVCGNILGWIRIRKICRALLIVYLGWCLGLFMMFQSGMIEYDVSLAGSNLSRLQLLHGLTATEVPIWIGLQIPILFMIINGSFARIDKRLALLLLLFIVAVLAACASVAAISATVLVIMLFITYGSSNTRKWFLVRLFWFTAILLIFGSHYFSELYESVQVKMGVWEATEERGLLYRHLIYIFEDNLWWGIGLGHFQEVNSDGWGGVGLVPHNNLLGIAAELGIFSLITYFSFILSVIWYFRGQILEFRRVGENSVVLILIAVLGIFVYQQARGFLQDTWGVKEMYFWVGFGIGVTCNSNCYLVRKSARPP
jgi:hypothetical protein